MAGEGARDYRVRKGSIRTLEVAGHPAMSYISGGVHPGTGRLPSSARMLT